MDFPVKKRYGNEVLDIKEFIKPSTLMVRQVVEEFDNLQTEQFIETAWNFVVNSVKYPYFNTGNIALADRHMMGAYLEKKEIVTLFNNTVIAGSFSALVRNAAKGTLKVGFSPILRDVVIANGVYQFINSMIKSNSTNLPYAVKYKTFDFWNFPQETLRDFIGDCEDTSILLASILRNKLSENNVYVTIGYFDNFGHAWVTIRNIFNEDKILETTGDNVLQALESANTRDGHYTPVLMFNDKQVIILREQDQIIVHENTKDSEALKIKALKNYYNPQIH